MKVLTIAPWYPSEKDKMAGLFVQNFVDETSKSGAIHEVFSGMNLWSILKGVIHYSKRENRPDIVHLHVATKQGLIAMHLKKRYNVPYLITEHWSGYYPESGLFEKKVRLPIAGRLYLRFTKRVFDCASRVTGVSEQLLGRLRELGLIEGGEVLYNIVPEFFAKEDIGETHGCKENVKETHGCASLRGEDGEKEWVSGPVPLTRFVNVSCFDNAAKNLTGIVDAVKLIREKDFIFTFIGDGKDKEMVMEYAHRQEVDDKVEFTGEIEPRDVAQRMREADCLVINSNYETACVVLQEALAVGLPIISTRVGIAPEFAKHIRFVDKGESRMLAMSMAKFIDNPEKQYEGVDDFKQVPEKLYSIYETLLSC